MDSWTHAICDRCHEKYYPTRDPARMKKADLEVCCFCKELCMSGIYIRQDPTDGNLKCGGQHDD